MNTSLLRSSVLGAGLLLVGLVSASGQPGTGGGVEFSARHSWSASSGLDGGAAGAEVGVSAWTLGGRGSTRLGDDTSLLYGVEWQRHELDLAGEAWLPETLEAWSLPLGVRHRFDERWQLLATVSPRLAGEGGGAGRGFDAPVLALATYAASPELAWSFGLRYGARSEIELLPIAGVRWRFAPAWELAVAWPESGVSFRAGERLTLRAVVTVVGGDFRVDEDPRPVAQRAGGTLAGDWLEYRDVRGGLAADIDLGGGLALRAEVGKAISQRFEYADRGLELEAGNPLHCSLALRGRF